MKKITLILLIGLGLISCDKQTRFESKIVNTSGYDIIFYNEGYNEVGAFVDSVIVVNNSTEIIFFESRFTKVDNYSNCDFLTYNNSAIDSVKIIAPTNKTLNFSVDMTNKWIFNVVAEDFSGHGVCNCELKILDSDIQ